MSDKAEEDRLAEVFASLEHDLRNPLTAIMGFSDLLGMTNLDEGQRAHLARVQEASERLLLILETMGERATPPRTTVLYIEDDPANVGLIEGILIHRPAVLMRSAVDAASGLAALRAARPDLVLLDLGLPDRPGDEVLVEMRADPATADIPVVVMSGDSSPATRERLMAAGAQEFLTKPLDIVAFLELVDALVGSRPD